MRSTHLACNLSLTVTLALTLALLLGTTNLSHAQSTGAINLFSNGKKAPIYGIDTTQPLSSSLGGNRPLLGPGFVAELWYAKTPNIPAEDLTAVPNGRAFFIKNGVFASRAVVNLPGTFGGQNVTIQIRVWEITTGVNTWADLLLPEFANVPRGQSITKNIALGGFLPTGAPNLPASINNFFPSFGLSIIPEPSTLTLLGLSLPSALLLRRRQN